MSKIIQAIFIGTAVIFMGFITFSLTPVPPINERNAIVETGKVVYVGEGGVKDVVLRLEGNKRVFYLNRGLEKTPDINYWRNNLLNTQVTFKYPKYWTPLDPKDKTKHVCIIENETGLFYDEGHY
ncbi:MAG: hypothetical protein ACJATA_000873 [Sphingobacteriales bacterium]|jgi:hypothetical protein